MIIASSVPTMLGEIIKQAQEIASEGRWLEYYAHCNTNDTTINCLEDCVHNIEDCLKVIKENIEDLKGEEV